MDGEGMMNNQAATESDNAIRPRAYQAFIVQTFLSSTSSLLNHQDRRIYLIVQTPKQSIVLSFIS